MYPNSYKYQAQLRAVVTVYVLDHKRRGVYPVFRADAEGNIYLKTTCLKSLTAITINHFLMTLYKTKASKVS